MSRKLETKHHREAENRIATFLSHRWECNFVRTAEYSPIDYHIIREQRVVGVAEIKNRENRKLDDFFTLFLNLDKWHYLINWEIAMRKPAFYVAGCTDGLFYVRIGPLTVNSFQIYYKGRIDRADVFTDIRPAIAIPIAEFKRLDANPASSIKEGEDELWD